MCGRLYILTLSNTKHQILNTKHWTLNIEHWTLILISQRSFSGSILLDPNTFCLSIWVAPFYYLIITMSSSRYEWDGRIQVRIRSNAYSFWFSLPSIYHLNHIIFSPLKDVLRHMIENDTHTAYWSYAITLIYAISRQFFLFTTQLWSTYNLLLIIYHQIITFSIKALTPGSWTHKLSQFADKCAT